ncbi:hypothetical protein T12_9593 [Trichinella patagoniensis]|uniref:Uncharacterized protein n=1 Tax=Trichinella patagoniensis TaxID=990121 RepID=A0A0V0ZAI3_9BILA|nr:hypothetical protein T12_9593 [Trichinella patagoniensis]
MKKLQKQYPALQIYATQMIYGISNYKKTYDSHQLHQMCVFVNIHRDRMQTLNVQFIAQQWSFSALSRHELATLIKRTSATLLIAQPCHVN